MEVTKYLQYHQEDHQSLSQCSLDYDALVEGECLSV